MTILDFIDLSFCYLFALQNVLQTLLHCERGSFKSSWSDLILFENSVAEEDLSVLDILAYKRLGNDG
jgi:hypothetical protein